MFDVGFWELAIIGIVALVIVGPERLPGLARTAGLWVGKARRMISDVKRDIDRELKASELSELSSIKKDIVQASEEVRKATESVKEESGVDEVQSTLKQTFKEAAPTKQELDELDQAAKQFSDELENSPAVEDHKGEQKEDQKAERAAKMNQTADSDLGQQSEPDTEADPSVSHDSGQDESASEKGPQRAAAGKS